MQVAIPALGSMPLRRLGINSFWLLLARVSAQGLSLVLVALIARRLGPATLGDYTFVASIVFLGNVLTTFGTDTLLIRQLGRTRQLGDENITTALWVQLGFSLLFVTLAFAFYGGNSAIFLYSFSLLPLAFYSVYSAVLRGFERMDLYLLLNLAAAGLQLLAGLAALLTGADLMRLLVALVAAQTIAAVVAWRLCRPYLLRLPPLWRAPQVLTPIVIAALPFALLSVSAVIYQRMGVFALTAGPGSEATGWFSAASRIVETTKIAPQALLGALLPMMARRVTTREGSLLNRTSTALLAGGCVCAALALTFLASPLVNAIYGDQFAPAVQALQILAWGLVPFSLSSSISLRLVAEGREWAALAATIATLCSALLIFLILVPTFGLTGACWASVLAEALQAGVFLAVKRFRGS